MARVLREAGKIDRAIEDYNRTLELAPARADIHDRIAVLYWRQQKRPRGHGGVEKGAGATERAGASARGAARCSGLRSAMS